MDAAIRGVLVAADVDVVFLAGYMKKLGPLVLRAFERRILNTHPALLPRFGGPGMYGIRCWSGCDSHPDHGADFAGQPRLGLRRSRGATVGVVTPVRG
jgi:folate-dependent phosphoribosylglycinamide formyltransferase PurN